MTTRQAPTGVARPETYQALVTHLSEGMALLSAEWNVVSCNEAYVRILGCEDQPCASPFGLEAIHEEDRPSLDEALSELAVSPKGTCLLEYRVRRSDGTWVWLEA